MDDYNTWLLTESGDSILGGPTLQYFVGMADLSVKYTLEHRSAEPGVYDGDVFVHNDPFVAAAHQMDVAVYAPIFWDGKLFCWFFSAAHQNDLGGISIGSFCTMAEDIFDEPSPWPPTKLVERGQLRTDVLELFSRQSRTPGAVSLQLRAQIACVNTCKRRMEQVLTEYGPAVVKGAMRKMIADTSQAVSGRLLSIDDGAWEESYFLAHTEDGKIRRVRTTMRREGDQLIVGNDGTDEQFGPGNGTYHTFRSGMLAAASTMLAWDQLYCPAGVINHI
jgi:N-methylhydantoinase B